MLEEMRGRAEAVVTLSTKGPVGLFLFLGMHGLTLPGHSAGAEHAKRMLGEVRGRAEAVVTLSTKGPVGLLSLLDGLLPTLSLPGGACTCHAMLQRPPGLMLAACILSTDDYSRCPQRVLLVC